MTAVRPRLRLAARELGRAFPNRDLSLWAAGATFFGLIGVVPIVMLSLRLAVVLVGPATVLAGVDAGIGGLPPGHGTPVALRTLAATAVDLDPLHAAVLLFPAVLYGEGLRRAFLQLAPREPTLFTGWRGRLGLLPVLAVAPVLVLVALYTAPVIAPLYVEAPFRGVVAGFHLTWVLISVTLVLVYRWVAAGRLGVLALLVGGFGTGAVVAGFLQGFLLFLAIPVEWSVPFGGLPVVGAVAALGLWLYLLHVLVLVGYRLALVVDAR